MLMQLGTDGVELTTSGQHGGLRHLQADCRAVGELQQWAVGLSAQFSKTFSFVFSN